MCFSCDGGLKNWDPTDEPWTEHAKWFDQCHYLNLKKSPEFIELAKNATIQQQPQEQQQQHHEQISNHAETTNSHDPEETLASATTPKQRNSFPDSDSGCSSIEDLEMSETSSAPSTKELLAENERLKDEKSCRVCFNYESNVLFLPCRHLVTCPNCAVSLDKCPVCRSPIECTVKVFKS